MAAACVLKIAVVELTDQYLRIIEKSQADSNGFELLVSFEYVLNNKKSLIKKNVVNCDQHSFVWNFFSEQTFFVQRQLIEG